MSNTEKKPDCDKHGVKQFCNNKDVKTVQLRSQVTGGSNRNEYNGEVLNMCAECRKCNTGGFKIVKKN
jgi:hypothetical protein